MRKQKNKRGKNTRGKIVQVIEEAKLSYKEDSFGNKRVNERFPGTKTIFHTPPVKN